MGNKQTPAIRPMQFEGNSNDIFKDSVNLFRGDVNLSLDLVSLKGRNGLDVKLTASYGSNIKNIVNESNAKSPTSILGLGWTLPFEKIQSETRDNSSNEDNVYYIFSNNSSIELVRSNKKWYRTTLKDSMSTILDNGIINTTIQEAFSKSGLALSSTSVVNIIKSNTSWQIIDKDFQRIYTVERQDSELSVMAGGDTFECFQYDFSHIIYYPMFERWEIANDDGTTNFYGGLSSNQNAIQWKVVWGNWSGESNLTTSNTGERLQSRDPIAWNLASVENIWGDRILFNYETLEQSVGSDGLSFTKACYLSKITDMFNRSINLKYEEKEYVPNIPSGPREYIPNNFNDIYTKKPDNKPSPYQDRYETRFLKNIDVNNEDGDLLYTVYLDYDNTSNFSSYSKNDNLYGDTVKRTLKGIRRIFSDGNTKPGLEFMYFKAGDINSGALSAAILPEGARVEYQYKKQELPLCNREVTITNPWPRSSKPRIWFGSDYVFTAWVNESTNQLKVEIYTWLGRWQKWSPAQNIINTPLDINSLNVVVAEDFACLTYSTMQEDKSFVHAYHKNNTIWGEWFEENKLTIASKALRVALGDNFFLACDQDNRLLYRYTWDCFNKTWLINDISSILNKSKNHTRPYITASNKYYAVLNYDTQSIDKPVNELSLFYQDNMYNWHEGSKKTLSFTIGGYDPENSFGFVSSSSFIAMTYINSEYSLNFDYTVKVIQWDNLFNTITDQNFSYTLPKSNPSKKITIPYFARIINNSMIASGPYLLRYNGEGWLENKTLNFRDYCSDADIFWYAYGKDYAIFTSNREYSCESKLLDFDPNTSSKEWTNTPTTLYSNDDSISNRKIKFFPTAGIDIATMGNRIYKRGTQCSWSEAVKDYYEFSDKINTTTMINQGPHFLSYLNLNGDSAKNSSLCPLQNQEVTEEQIIDQRFYTQISSTGMMKANSNGQCPSGTNSFVTYLPLDKDFDYADSITLHRFLDNSLKGCVVDYCVDSMTIDDGYQLSSTKYVFDINSATCDPTGSIIKYYRSLSYPGTTSIETPKFGYIENTFYNGLIKNSSYSPSSIQVQLNAESAPNLLDGQLICRKVFNADGKLLFSETKQLKTYTSISIKENTYKLFGGYFRCVKNEIIEDGLSKTSLYNYETSFGKLKEEIFDNINEKGEIETISKKYVYAFEVYDWFLERNIIDAYVAQYDSVSSLNNKDLITGASLQTYAPFNTKLIAPNAEVLVWSTFESYVLKEAVTTPILDFKSLTQSKPSEEWQLINTIQKRSNHGVICQQQDISEKVETTILDKNEVLNVAVFKNTGVNECAYVGFEKYENYEADWYTSKETLTKYIVDGDAQTGSCSFKLSPQLSLKKLESLNQSQTIILSAWIKAEKNFIKEDGNVYVEIKDASGKIKNFEITPEAEEKWEYWQKSLDFDGETKNIISLAITNNKKSKSLLINNFCISPLLSEIDIKVYDPFYKDEIAKIGKNADIARYAYDPFRLKVLEVGPWETVKKGTNSYLAREWITDASYSFPKNSPNSTCDIVAAEGGFYETFTKGEEIWNEWSSANKNTWQIEAGKLKHLGTSESNINWTVTKNESMYAAGFSISSKATKDISFGFNIGDKVTVYWSFDTGWTITLEDKTFRNTLKNIKRPVNILFIPTSNAVYLFADGREILAQKIDIQISGGFSFTAKGDVTFSNPVIFLKPQISMDYMDGYGKVIQSQIVCEGKGFIKQTLYNELSLKVIETKIATFENFILSYNPNFVEGIDWNTGVMTGEICNFYPKDEGYPYSRNEYENSSLGRLIKKGLPGKEFAITNNNTHITQLQYGIEDQKNIANIPFRKGNYIVNLIMDSNGAKTYEIKDKLGRTLGKQTTSKIDGKTIEAVQQVYDISGNLVKILHPNYFKEENATEAFYTTKKYNYLRQVTSVKTVDAGETKFIYNKAGMLRFSLSPLALEKGNILYKKYDSLGRITEEGWFAGEWGDGSALQKIADTDPNYPKTASWLNKTEYDGNGEDFKLIGRIWKSYSNSVADGTAEVENHYEYDIFGNTILSEISVKGCLTQSTNYKYDKLGHVVEVQYPSSTSFPKIIYSYNALGQTMSVGTPDQPEKFSSYTYNADGSLEAEKFNNNGLKPINRSITYNSPGWITGITSEFINNSPILKQSLYYTSGGYNGASYYNGNIAKISTENGIVNENSFDYSYKYDSLGQLEVAEHSSNQAFSLGVGSDTIFDPNGNMLSLQIGNSINTYKYDEYSNKVLSVLTNGNISGNYKYDSYGNVILSSTNNISLIEYNQLTNLPDKVYKTDSNINNISFTYNSLHQRVVRTEANGTQKLYVHGLNELPLLEIDKESIQYIYGVGGLLAFAKGGKVYFVMKDHQGSVRVVADENGNIESMIDYLPFGEVMPNSYGNSDIISYKFTGQEFEKDINLYNYRARFYDPKLGRFYSIDPKFQYGSPYVYCGNDPINLTDPSGEEIATILVILIIGAITGAAIGGGTAAYKGYNSGLRGGSLCGYILAGAGIGAVAGALSSAGGVGAFAAGSAAAAATTTTAAGIVAGIAAGASTGAVIGSGIGAAQGVSQHFINDAFGVKNDGSWQNSMLTGALTGAISGAVSGAAAGYGGARAALESIKFAKLAEVTHTDFTFNYNSLTQVSNAYDSFGKLGVIPLPSFISRVPNINLYVTNLQTFVLSKFSLPTLSSMAGAATSFVAKSVLPSPKQTEYYQPPVQQSYITTDNHSQKSFNPSINMSVGMKTTLLFNPSSWMPSNQEQ
ncbi:MAG: repeat protein [Anaerocolumna sp.]|jgi:RHS repeat-associated protein|nr:repeat protein [Anaerocolumna sp.]